MNQEIANFFIEFTTKGMAELKEGLGDIQRSVEDFRDEMKKADGDGKNLFGSLGSWLKTIGALTAGFLSLRAAIRSVFAVKGDVLDLYNMADLTRISPKTLEGLGIATEQFKGGGIQAAFDFAANANNMLAKMRDAEYLESWNKAMAKSGFYLSYNPGLSVEENMLQVMEDLHRGFTQGGFYNGLRVKEAFGISDAMYQLLQDPNWRTKLNAGMDKAVLSKDPKNQQNAVDLDIAAKNLHRAVQDLMAQFMPVVTALIDEFATPLIKNFADFVRDKDLPNIMRNWIKELSDWVNRIWPEIKHAFQEFLFIMKGLFEVFFGDEGTIWSRWRKFKKDLAEHREEQKPKALLPWYDREGNKQYLSDINPLDPKLKPYADAMGLSIDKFLKALVLSGEVFDDIEGGWVHPMVHGAVDHTVEQVVNVEMMVDPTQAGKAMVGGDGTVTANGGMSVKNSTL